MSRAASWSDIDALQVMFRFNTLGETGAQLAHYFAASRSGICGLVHRIKCEADAVLARRYSDNDLRELLVGFFERGVSAERLAKDFALTRNGVLYLIWWVMNDLAFAGSDDCEKRDNTDFGLPHGWPSWWRPVSVQGVAA